MNPSELRAAVLLQMDRAGICTLPAVCGNMSPLTWPWGNDQIAAYRAYCDRKGLTFSTTPSTERQSQAVIADWQYLVAHEIRPLVQKHAKQAASRDAVTPATAVNFTGTFGDVPPPPLPPTEKLPATPAEVAAPATATTAPAQAAGTGAAQTPPPAAPAPKTEAAPAATGGNDLSSLLDKSKSATDKPADSAT